MERINDLQRICEILNDLMEGQDPIQDKPLSRPSAVRETLVRSCLYRASCFLREIIAQNAPADLPPFFLTAEQQERLVPADGPVRQAELLRRIRRAAEGNACRPLIGAELTAWLVDKGLFLPFPDDNEVYTLDPDGEAAGLYFERTDEFPVLYFAPSAQQLIFDHIGDILQYTRSRAMRLPALPVSPKLLPTTVQDMEQLSRGCHPETGKALLSEDPLRQEALRAAFAQAAEALRQSMERNR